jgi:hypothetical protein
MRRKALLEDAALDPEKWSTLALERTRRQNEKHSTLTRMHRMLSTEAREMLQKFCQRTFCAVDALGASNNLQAAAVRCSGAMDYLRGWWWTMMKLDGLCCTVAWLGGGFES